MFQTLNKLLTSILPAGGSRRKSKRVAQEVQALEIRLTPTVTLVGSYYYVAVQIEGSQNADVVTVSQSGYGRYLQLHVTENGVTTTFANPVNPYTGAKIKGIHFNGYGGDDHFVNNTGLTSFANGGLGTDYLYGGYNTDFLSGNDGADFLFGREGNDTLDGGDDGDADFLQGGIGLDKFQMEGHGNPNNPILMYWNLDHPADYNAAEDVMYGEDQMVLDPGSATGEALTPVLTAEHLAGISTLNEFSTADDFGLTDDLFSQPLTFVSLKYLR